MKPLVSILIPAFNAEATIAQTLEAATSQTWNPKEIIVVDDGSTDRTAKIGKQFAAKGVKVVSTENHGLAGAVNNAYSHSQGDYIQELDADDLISSDKIELQLAALRDGDSKRLLLSSPWAHFYYRPRGARFVRTALWNDLSPTEWLLNKMGRNLHMQNATWLVSRELWDEVGSWNADLRHDQDGEFYCRVVTASVGTRFVPEGRVFYRVSGAHRVSFVGRSDVKKESLLRSMQVHVKCLRSLEESDRVRAACLAYLQEWSSNFYPERPDLIAQVETLAAELGGALQVPPPLRWKYAWMTPVFGRKAAVRAQMVLPEVKSALVRSWDRALYKLESHKSIELQTASAKHVTLVD